MGKVLIVAIFVIAAILAVIVLTVQDKTEEIPELTSSNIAELQAKALSHEAIVYGMKNLNNGTVTASTAQTYTNFEVLDGTIDSIQYVYDDTSLTKTIEITSYASYQNMDETLQHKGSALVWWAPYVQDAMLSNGPVTVTGSANFFGSIADSLDPYLDFEGLFGVDSIAMKAMADTIMMDPGVNPEGVEDITWVAFANEGGNLKVTVFDWEGSGILIVEGDAQFSGGTFNGIMWIKGDLFINGNNTFNGAIYVEGSIHEEDVPNEVVVCGNCQIVYDLQAILDAFDDAGLTLDYDLNIISWFEDFEDE